jgi:Na+-driven multidrug efflux pump
MASHGEEAVAGLAIVSRLIPVAFGVLFALSGAVGPIIGQNHGAGRTDRVRRAFRDALVFAALVTALVSAALFALRAPIADLFGASGTARSLVYLFCGPLALAWVFNGAIFVGNAAFNNLGRPFLSTWVNWGRHTLGTIPFVLAGSALFGAEGVLIGQATGGVLFGLLALWLAHRIIDGPAEAVSRR